MPSRSLSAAAASRPVDQPTYPQMLAAYDRRTRAAYEVMGVRWHRFLAAKNMFRAAAPGSREWYAAAEHAYRLGLRSTHAYYIWTRGHATLALELTGGRPETPPLALQLRRELQSLRAATIV